MPRTQAFRPWSLVIRPSGLAGISRLAYEPAPHKNHIRHLEFVIRHCGLEKGLRRACQRWQLDRPRLARYFWWYSSARQKVEAGTTSVTIGRRNRPLAA